ncbi:signal peptide peptidase SppA [candidate division KSB1 bacterium]|nr:MAG: signal peptide peptidase SppA [candidate division KSB1 bacterium]
MNRKTRVWIPICLGVLLLLGLIGIGLSVTRSIRGGDSRAPLKANTFLVLDLSGILMEYQAQPAINIWVRNKPVTVSDVLRVLDHAASDPKIEGIVLRPAGAMGFADLRELREGLMKFKTSKKPVYAFLEIATDRDYYLSSVADSIVITPAHSGCLTMLGLSISSTYLARTFDKVGLKFHALHVGDYKGAYENFARDEMSGSLRESLQYLLDDMYRTYTQEIAASRSALPLGRLENEILCGEKFCISGDEAVCKGFADFAMDWGDFRERLRGKNEKFNAVSPSRYLRGINEESFSDAEIAVVFAEGEISYRSEKSGPLDMESGIVSDRMVSQLRDLREDDDVKAVVLRVNSPGGSALASEIILREVQRLKTQKPVVVSLGNVAASGGYYIACAGDRVIAQPNTITGSIGVVTLFPTAAELFRKIGARVETVEKGKWAEYFRVDRDLTDEQKNVLLGYMSGVYDEFCAHVAEGRGLSMDEVKAVGEGRVWTGSQAMERKLVDELGGLDLAIERAKELAKIKLGEKVTIGRYPREKDFLSAFFRQMLSDVQLRWRVLLPYDHDRELRTAYEALARFMSRREFVQAVVPLDLPDCSPYRLSYLTGE